MACTLKFHYRITRTADDVFHAHFDQLPELDVTAPTVAKLLASLEANIIEALENRLRRDEPMPQASPCPPDEAMFHLSLTHAIKLELNHLVRSRDLSNVDLAALLGCAPQEIPRILRLSHATKIERLLEALHQLGYQLDFSITPDPFARVRLPGHDD